MQSETRPNGLSGDPGSSQSPGDDQSAPPTRARRASAGPTPHGRRGALLLAGVAALGLGSAACGSLRGSGGGAESAPSGGPSQSSSPAGGGGPAPGASPGAGPGTAPGSPDSSYSLARPRQDEGDDDIVGQAPDASNEQAMSTPPTQDAHNAPDSMAPDSMASDAASPGGGAPSSPAEPSAEQSAQPPSAGADGSAGNGSAAMPGAPQAYGGPAGDASVNASTELAPGLELKTSPAWHLARRASPGATADLVADIEAMGAEAWIDQQLAPEGIDDSLAEGIVSTHFGWANMSYADLVVATSNRPFEGSAAVSNAILARRRFTKRVLKESVVEMLGDHVYVPLHGKGESFVAGFDQLLNKHALGRYADFLHAALTDCALLEELDNVESTGDNPNENLGRELLELYTVGRETYTEDDVKASTILLTGHGRDPATNSYVYNPDRHATGAVRVLDYAEDNADPARGPQILKNYVEYLCSHEATATRLATRIARRFISDQPGQEVVAHIAKAYLDNDTRIGPAVKAALTHPDFAASVGKKWRRPSELFVTIARASHPQSFTPMGAVSGGKPYDQGVLGWLLGQCGHSPRNYPTVDGYPDTAEYWMSSSLLMTMWNGAQHMAHGDKQETGVTDWVSILQVKAGESAWQTAQRITWHLTGYTWSDAHLAQVAGILAGLPESGEATSWTVTQTETDTYTFQAVRLCFASPYGLLR